MSSTQRPSENLQNKPKVEQEHVGSVWKHPYMIYIALTAAIFLFILVVGYLAWVNQWIPNRRIT